MKISEFSVFCVPRGVSQVLFPQSNKLLLPLVFHRYVMTAGLAVGHLRGQHEQYSRTNALQCNLITVHATSLSFTTLTQILAGSAIPIYHCFLIQETVSSDYANTTVRSTSSLMITQITQINLMWSARVMCIWLSSLKDYKVDQISVQPVWRTDRAFSGNTPWNFGFHSMSSVKYIHKLGIWLTWTRTPQNTFQRESSMSRMRLTVSPDSFWR